MARISVKIVETKDEWEGFLAKHPEANFLQSWHFGEFHAALGKTIIRSGFYFGNDLEGVMLSVIEDAKRGRYLTVPGGPIIDWNTYPLVEAFVSELRQIAQAHRCVFARVRPQLASNKFSRKMFQLDGFTNAPMHLHAELTSQLDITKSEGELLAGMRKSTRYEIKKAASLAVAITHTDDPSAIESFYELQMDTAKRQKFVPFSYTYLFEQFRIFAAAGDARVYSAEYKGTILAQAIILFYGSEAVYHYGASTPEARKYPAAYLIQWEAIKEAKRRGMTRYNFWGVAPADQMNHRFYGVSVFKRGFGGVDVEYLHAQDSIVNKPKYLINFAIEQIRKKIRGL